MEGQGPWWLSPFWWMCLMGIPWKIHVTLSRRWSGATWNPWLMSLRGWPCRTELNPSSNSEFGDGVEVWQTTFIPPDEDFQILMLCRDWQEMSFHVLRSFGYIAGCCFSISWEPFHSFVVLFLVCLLGFLFQCPRMRYLSFQCSPWMDVGKFLLLLYFLGFVHGGTKCDYGYL